jgi:NAD-dependent deacetylase
LEHKDLDMSTLIDRAALLLRSSERVAVLTGAGVSAESGLATFRGAGGLWEGHRVEDVATPFAFKRDPELVWRFYNMRREALARAEPNPGHVALVELERRKGVGNFALITQNVDGLHTAAGSSQVWELHGNIRRVRCTGCAAVSDRGLEILPDLPRCLDCGSLLRPDIVWFHEALPVEVWNCAERAARHCDCLIVAGTSAIVYPAAGLIEIAARAGASVIEINVEWTATTGQASIFLEGPTGRLLPELVKRM